MRYDDSDMKIVPDRPSEVFDMAEGAANAFARETANGNMEKARMLGGQFAAELTAEAQGASLFGVGAFDNACTLEQRKVLFSYIVNRVIEDMAPNSIVAQSALSVFYEDVRGKAPALYEAISDSAAFSLYILSDRSDPENPEALGRVFARLCERADDPVFIRYGRELASYFLMYCTQLVLKVQLVR